MYSMNDYRAALSERDSHDMESPAWKLGQTKVQGIVTAMVASKNIDMVHEVVDREGVLGMKELLRKIKVLEKEMDKAQDQSEYWLEDEHFDLEKSERFEKEADAIYERLYKLLNQTADRIVSITSGQVDKVTAMTMIRCRRSEIERIFA